jgi:uracil-DNA glycosylase family 4
MPFEKTNLLTQLQSTVASLREYMELQKERGLTGFDLAREDLRSKSPIAPGGTLDDLRAEIGECARCGLAKSRNCLVFGEGDENARLMFIGEGPGHEEDLSGRPFVGRAGQLLDKMIAAMGLKRSEVYIGNIVKCRPPQNREPASDEVASCIPFLHRQIEIIKPRVICCLGRVATQNLLEVKTPVSRLRGNFTPWRGIRVMPTYHPVYLLRNPASKREAWDDLQQIMKELDLPERAG